MRQQSCPVCAFDALPIHYALVRLRFSDVYEYLAHGQMISPGVREDLNDMIRNFVCILFLNQLLKSVRYNYHTMIFEHYVCVAVAYLTLFIASLIMLTVVAYKLWETAWEIVGIYYFIYFKIFTLQNIQTKLPFE
jgi:hypothetical protein